MRKSGGPFKRARSPSAVSVAIRFQHRRGAERILLPDPQNWPPQPSMESNSPGLAEDSPLVASVHRRLVPRPNSSAATRLRSDIRLRAGPFHRKRMNGASVKRRPRQWPRVGAEPLSNLAAGCTRRTYDLRSGTTGGRRSCKVVSPCTQIHAKSPTATCDLIPEKHVTYE